MFGVVFGTSVGKYINNVYTQKYIPNIHVKFFGVKQYLISDFHFHEPLKKYINEYLDSESDNDSGWRVVDVVFRRIFFVWTNEYNDKTKYPIQIDVSNSVLAVDTRRQHLYCSGKYSIIV